MANISIRDVAKSFGALQVIHDVNVEVEDGEFVVLVGPSGCGKSTLLRMIAGLESISDGEIVIGGRVVNDLPPKDRDVAMVFQSYALYPHKTVAENVGFPLRMAGRPRRESDDKVAAAAAVLGLVPLLERFPRELSGGQRQRVAMGRAIVRDPQVFLFDEPLSNLDAKLRVTMRVEIKQLHQRLGATIVYVTHDQVEAMTMADKIVVMHDGRVEQMGAPLDLYDRPDNVFVAGFIGSPAMNLLRGQIGEGPDGPAFLPEAAGPPLPIRAAGAEPGRSVTYGIRPEHVAIGDGGIPLEVMVVEPTGAETQILGRAGGLTLDAVVRERIRVGPGAKLPFRIDPALVHLFDGTTGLRL